LLPLQHPIVQAKAWATLDWLSGGRAAPIFGVGWLKEEFDYLNVEFQARGKISDEYIAAMIAFWEQDAPVFSGSRISFTNVHAAPRPLQRPFPIWFGGDAEPVLEHVARFGDGWSPLHTPPQRFPACLDAIHSQPDYNGKTTGLYYALETLSLGPQHVALQDDRTTGLWNPQQIIDQCGWLARLGVTETNLPLPILHDYNAYLDRIRWVAEEVFPAFSNAD
jgi:hypothetical protein